MTLKFVLTLVVLTLSWSSPAYSQSKTEAKGPQPPSGKLFRFRLPFEPATLDWTLGDVPIAVIQNAMRGLYRVDESGKLQRDLLESDKASADLRTWTFQLHSGVLWSDGVPLTAEHAATALRRLQNPATGSSYSSFLRGMTSAKATSPLTFEVQFSSPKPEFPAVLSHWTTYPVRPDLLAKWKDYGRNPAHMATLGAFRIDDWQHDLRIVMSPNPHAKTQPWLKRVEAWIVVDDATSFSLYETGHLEYVTDPGLESRKLRDLKFQPAPIETFIGIGPGHPITSSRAGTLALSAALNRSEIPSVLGAPHRPTIEFCPPELWERIGKVPAPAQLDAIPLAGDSKLAQDLFKETGLDAKKIPPLKLLYFNRPAMKLLAEWLQAQWKKNLGVSVELESMDTKAYWATLAQKPAALFLNTKGASYPDPDSFFSLMTSKNPQNLGRWKDAQYDRWVDEAAAEPNPDARRALYLKASRRLLVEKPGVLPLYLRSTDYLVKPFVNDFKINPLTTVDFTTVNYEKKK